MSMNNFQVSLSKNILILLNIIGVIFAITFNTLSNVLPFNNKNAGEISDSLYNFFAPSGYVFAIWFIIYLGWVVLILYLLLDRENSEWFLDRVNIWLFLNLILNGLWLVFWHYDQYLISVFVMLGIFGTLAITYLRLEIGSKDYSIKEIALIQLPIGIYFGWITVATIANITSYLVSINISFGSFDPIITIIVLLVGTLITISVLYTKKDVFFALVPVWAFIGIFVKQNSELIGNPTSIEVAYSALLFAGLIFLATLYFAYIRFLKK